MAALGLTGLCGLPLTKASATAAVYTSSQDAGTADFSTRTACSAGTGYPAAVIALGPTLYYRFDEAAAPAPATVADSSGNGNTGTVVAGVPASLSLGFGAPSPIWCDTTSAMVQPLVDRTSTTAGFVVWPSLRAAPDVFTLLTWVKIPNGMSTGGRIIGLSGSDTVRSNTYDRHIFIDNSGRARFGIWTGAPNMLVSPSPLNDGNVHQLAASLGPSGGRLYVDGALVASAPAWTAGQSFNGYWRIGWDNLTSWLSPTDPADFGLDGAVIDEVAVFEGKELTPTEVADTYALNHW